MPDVNALLQDLTPDAGVWVHNSDCGKAEAISAVDRKVDLQAACFLGDTYVLAPNGAFDKIENLTVGDLVMSRCERTGEMAPKRVLKIYERSARRYSVSIILGPQLAKRKGFLSSDIHTTEEHPFWVQGKGWMPVRELQPGDTLFTHDGDPATVDCVVTPEELDKFYGYRGAPSPVYNLEVEDFNTYFVDIAGVWVHNCNNTIPGVEIRGPGIVDAVKPEWSPFHLSTAELLDLLERVKDGKEIKHQSSQLKPQHVDLKAGVRSCSNTFQHGH